MNNTAQHAVCNDCLFLWYWQLEGAFKLHVSVEQLLKMDGKAETGMLKPIKWVRQKASCQTVNKSDSEPLFSLIVSHSEYEHPWNALTVNTKCISCWSCCQGDYAAAKGQRSTACTDNLQQQLCILLKWPWTKPLLVNRSQKHFQLKVCHVTTA